MRIATSSVAAKATSNAISHVILRTPWFPTRSTWNQSEAPSFDWTRPKTTCTVHKAIGASTPHRPPGRRIHAPNASSGNERRPCVPRTSFLSDLLRESFRWHTHYKLSRLFSRQAFFPNRSGSHCTHKFGLQLTFCRTHISLQCITGLNEKRNKKSSALQMRLRSCTR